MDSDGQGYGVKGFGSIVCLDLWTVMSKGMELKALEALYVLICGQ